MRDFVIYTCWMGMIEFNYTMFGIEFNGNTKYYYTHEKRKDQFSFVTKHGMYKARSNYKTFKLDVYYGTNYLFSTNELKEIDKYIKNESTKSSIS